MSEKSIVTMSDEELKKYCRDLEMKLAIARRVLRERIAAMARFNSQKKD